MGNCLKSDMSRFWKPGPRAWAGSAERGVVGLPNRGCNRWVRERARIEPLMNVVRAGVNVLPRDYVGKASEIRGGWSGTPEA